MRAVGRTVAMVVMTLVGVGILVADVREIAQTDSHISDLRAHGRRVPGNAALGYSCSSGRGGGCSVTGVQLIFRAADGDPEYVPEEELGESLYVPSGRPSGDEGLVPTTVVYDPADPQDAQAAGALHWGVVDLIAHRWLSLALGVVLTGVGAAALVIDRV